MDDENRRIEFPTDEDCAYHHGARRQHSRWLLHADVEIETSLRSRGVTLNASAGGLRVAVDAPLPENTEVMFRLVQGQLVVRKRARVVWQRRLPDGFVAGLAFAKLEPMFANEDALVAPFAEAA